MTIVFGVLQVTIAIWAHGWSESVVTEALTIAGFSAGLLLGIFLLGTLVARAGQGAALVGFAAGLIAVCFVRWGVVYAFGLPKPIAWPAVVTFSVGAVASLTRQAGRGGPPPPNSDPPETR